MDRIQRDRTVARDTAIVIGLVLLTAIVLLLAYEIRRVLVWVVIAIFFAVALHPVVNWVQRRMPWCKRWLATLLVFIVALVVLAGLAALFVVPLVREGSQLARQLPDLIEDVRAGRGPVGDLNRRFHLLEWVQQHRDQLQQYAGGVGGTTLAFVGGVATTVVGVVTIFVLSYLMVLQAPRIIETFLALFEARRAQRIGRVAGDCARTITGYISGNLLISVICGALTYVVLLVLGVPYAGLIAVFVAIADLIPLVGATLGAIVATLAGFIHSITAGVIVIVFFILYQQLENHLLQPLILSRTVKLNPLTVLLAILVGVEVAGILGALLAIPVAGMLQIIARDLWNERRGRLNPQPALAGSEPPPPPPPPTAVEAEAEHPEAMDPPRSDPPRPDGE